MVADEMLTLADMARRYRKPTAAAFYHAFWRDRKRPPELRLYPDPINPDYRSGAKLLWSPGAVAAHLAGEPPRLRDTPKRGRR